MEEIIKQIIKIKRNLIRIFNEQNKNTNYDKYIRELFENELLNNRENKLKEINQESREIIDIINDIDNIILKLVNQNQKSKNTSCQKLSIMII